MVLEETDVLGARVNLYLAEKKWDMAAFVHGLAQGQSGSVNAIEAVASHLVKVDPETAGRLCV
jgi:hypothetical protein